jgi:endo-1,4-beta-D-glucanase Y
VRRRLAPIAALLAAAAVAAAVALAATGAKPARDAAADRFLDRYMQSGGRVVRRDQGGDSVSEGQAYAMLLAAATGDRRRFDAAWSWARRHLQRPGGLLSWHWIGGRVADRQPAADADLDAAWALALAARRFHSGAYRRAAARIARAVLAHETAPIAGKTILLAGPWARGQGTVNPSYFSPGAYAALARVAPDPRWARLAAASRRLLVRLPSPPPDWARMDAAGVHPTGPPGTQQPPGYGYDAYRAPVRYAASCSAADRGVAARYWPALRGATGNPVASVAAAAAAHAAGDKEASGALLHRAEQQDARHRTYYGSAWVALGRELLQGDEISRCG